MTHGGEEAATHGGDALSYELEWWDHFSVERKAFAAATLKEAVEAGASVETTVHELGHTAYAYHWTARNGHFEIMDWLARKGADRSARDKSVGTPMH